MSKFWKDQIVKGVTVGIFAATVIICVYVMAGCVTIPNPFTPKPKPTPTPPVVVTPPVTPPAPVAMIMSGGTKGTITADGNGNWHYACQSDANGTVIHLYDQLPDGRIIGQDWKPYTTYNNVTVCCDAQSNVWTSGIVVGPTCGIGVGVRLATHLDETPFSQIFQFTEPWSLGSLSYDPVSKRIMVWCNGDLWGAFVYDGEIHKMTAGSGLFGLANVGERDAVTFHCAANGDKIVAYMGAPDDSGGSQLVSTRFGRVLWAKPSAIPKEIALTEQNYIGTAIDHDGNCYVALSCNDGIRYAVVNAAGKCVTSITSLPMIYGSSGVDWLGRWGCQWSPNATGVGVYLAFQAGGMSYAVLIAPDGSSGPAITLGVGGQPCIVSTTNRLIAVLQRGGESVEVEQ